MADDQVKKNHSAIAITALLFSQLAVVSSQALAEKWYFEPTASLRSGYDDNVRLSANHQEGDYSTLLNVDMRFGARTEISDTEFQVQLDSEKFAQLKELDSNDQKFGLVTDYRNGLDLFGLTAAYERDSTRNTELTTTGSIQTNNRRILKSFTPSWQRQVTERSAVFANYRYSDIRYDGNAASLVDYWNDAATVGISHNLTERTTVQASLGLSRVEAEAIASKYQSQNLRVGFSHQLSETASGGLTLGYSQTDSDFLGPGGIPTTVSDDSLQLEATFRKQYPTMLIETGLSVSEQPGSNGRLLQTTALSLDLKRKLTARLNFALDIKAYENETGGGLTNTTDSRQFFSVRPKLLWRATEWWTITGEYRYRQQEYTSTGNGAAASNALFITARYVWPREKLARWMDL